MVNSRNKGQRGERYFIDLLKPIFPHAHRNWHEQTAVGGVDINNTQPFDLECKVGKQADIKTVEKWLKQVKDEGNELHHKAVLCKPDRKEAYVIMPFEDWLELVERYMA